jgi:large subunit ribosomal protein L17
MRHGIKGRKLGRTTPHRRALFRNQLAALVERERIITTLPKAKELRRLVERVVTRGRADTIQTRRWVRTWLQERSLVRKVFDDISPRFADRPGGYTRIIKLGPRSGDGAELVALEFVDFAGGAGAAPAAGESESAEKKPAAKPAKKKAAKAAKGGAAKKPPGKKPPAKKAPAEKAPAKKAPAKRAPAKRAPAKKPSA